MRNPLRSETDAFRFVLLTIAYFALIVIGSLIDVWVGVGVFAVLTLAALWRVFTSTRRRSPPVLHVAPPADAEERRLLVVANEALASPGLHPEVTARTGPGAARVLLVAPVLVTPVERLTNDDGDARAAAKARLDQAVASLRSAGLETRGEIGDADPVLAAEDAVRTFRPDEVVIATRPGDEASWVEEGALERVRERVAVPVTHVVVDLDADAS